MNEPSRAKEKTTEKRGVVLDVLRDLLDGDRDDDVVELFSHHIALMRFLADGGFSLFVRSAAVTIVDMGYKHQGVQWAVAAYAAGYECGRFGATATNASAEHAVTQPAEREWLRGYQDGRAAAALPHSPVRCAA